MTASEALATIRRLAAAGRVVIEGDANWAMGAHGVSFADVVHALATATTATAAQGERWHVTGGTDEDGRALGVVLRQLVGDAEVEALIGE